MVNNGDKMKESESLKNTRLTISFPNDTYLKLEDLAKEKDVSIAWVVRDALKLYFQSNEQNKSKVDE